MQIFTHFPSKEDLPLRVAPFANELIEHLACGLGSTHKAKAYWQAYPCLFLIFQDEADKFALSSLSTGTLRHIVYALEYPEYMDDMHGHDLLLGITNDEGNGVYLLIPHSIGVATLKRWLADA